MSAKVCRGCGEEKSENEFRIRSKQWNNNKIARYNYCRSCERLAGAEHSKKECVKLKKGENQRLWRKTENGKKSTLKYLHSEKRRKTVANYRMLDRVKAARKEEAKIYESSFHGRFIVLRKGARRRGLVFELTEKHVFSLLLQPCYYCGRNIQEVKELNELIAGYSGGNLLLCKAKKSISYHVFGASCMSIDRKDSLVGYTIDNCATCCGICNVVKGWALTSDEYMTVARTFIGRLVSAAKEESCQEC